MADEADRRLGESVRQFRLLLESITDYAIYMLDPNGHVLSWNPGAVRIMGYEPEEVLGRHFSMFYPATPRWGRRFKDILIGQPLEEDGWRVRKDGTRFWASVTLTPLRDETGKLVGYAEISRDMTERRQVEEAEHRLARMNDRVEVAQRVQNGTIGELFRIGMELQGIAARTEGTSVQVRLDKVVADIDHVISDLRERLYAS